MFTEERPSFKGTFYTIDRALNRPRPIQPRGPRILIGGSGEKRTLKLAARFADMTNWFGTLEEASPHLAVLDRHCESVGRDPAEILRTVSVPIVLVDSQSEKSARLASLPEDRRGGQQALTVDEGIDLLHRYMDAGFGGFIFRNVTTRTPDDIARVGRLISTMRAAEGPA
jgi:alkanesulfonate monooxygenase SsuD/methylene tetrahydromethanopterin reductase-like flavin-dependent oxidoreductase (luciferase family)